MTTLQSCLLKCRIAMKAKKILALIISLLVAVPAFAVFDEEDLAKTLSVLRSELKQEMDRRPSQEGNIGHRERSQHRQLIGIMKKCNELSLMLYSQNQDYTFDLTYALKEVTTEYEEFNKQRLPFDDITSSLDLEIERYSRLVESLRRLPPRLREVENLPDSLAYHNDSLEFDAPILPPERFFQRDSLSSSGRMSTFFLDEKGQEDRDSCIFYATTILKMYSAAKDRIVEDSEHYEDADARLKESYDYAQKRYKLLQKKIFMGGQTAYGTVLRNFPTYWKKAVEDARLKYGRRFTLDGALVRSEWRGPMVLSFLALMLFFLAAATAISRIAISLLNSHGKLSGVFLSAYDPRLLTLLCGIIIFALVNGVGNITTDNNFFRLATGQLMVLSWLLAAIVASVMVRSNGVGAKEGIYLFMPIIIVGIVIIACRIIFIPNSMMNILFPPMLLAVLVWQFVICLNSKDNGSDADMAMAWISVVVLLVATVMSWTGYLLLGVQVLIWWLFQISAIETVMVLHLLLKKYEQLFVNKKKEGYSSMVVQQVGESHVRGEYIRVTWFSDFLSIAAIPIISILSVPLSIYLALNVFDLTDVYRQIMFTTFFDITDAEGKEMFKVSGQMIILASSMFFLFKYLNYLSQAMYRDIRFRNIARSSGKTFVHTNEVNLSLANNVISVIVWGIYIIITLILLKIPTGALSVVAAGLAAGLGLAMKDVLNNFIYGIQLMSGRMRVGDWVECDGVRGKVTAISYQSTQIETTDGAVMSFLNTSLFSKNYKNLTRNNEYEFVKIIVGVAYGTDVDKVRNLLLEALKQLQTKDAFRRNIVDTKKGVTVVFDGFGDNSVNIAVKQNVLVPERFGYEARAKEIIYNTLNANGISIPFPQRDIHIIKDSGSGE